MKRFRILAVDDEVRILNFIRNRLKAEGYEVLTAINGVDGLQKVHSQNPDMVLLDMLMPEMSGVEMLKELRTFSKVPVIVLSAKGSDADRIAGLELGADDYLAKPFNPDELAARIRALRRRLGITQATDTAHERISFGDVSVDFGARSVSVKGEIKRLTRIEWMLLCELASNAGHLMIYEDLLFRVWGAEYRNDVHLLRTWISRLRYKIEADPARPTLISTIPKVGYMMKHPPGSVSLN